MQSTFTCNPGPMKNSFIKDRFKHFDWLKKFQGPIRVLKNGLCVENLCIGSRSGFAHRRKFLMSHSRPLFSLFPSFIYSIINRVNSK